MTGTGSSGARADDGAPPVGARDLALRALRDRAGNVTAHLNRLIRQEHPPAAEAALARELALGVVRRRRTLDAVLSAFQRRPRWPIPGTVRQVLRLGAYQVLFLQRVPDFAAVHEAVEQVARRYRRLGGFVNAVLRSLARSAGAPEAGAVPPAADVLPVGAGLFRRFDRAIFPDPGKDPEGYLGRAFSLPEELAARWLKAFGGLTGAMPVATHANARPPLVLRVNAERASVPDVLARLQDAGVEATAHRNGLSVVVTRPPDLTGLEVFRSGLVQPQDPAATAIVAAADVRAGMRVLDLCAAPGTKTTHLAERMHNSGQIIACDVSAEKLARIEDNCRRMGHTIVRTVLSERLAEHADPPFDLVLVDAPCSNTGVLARRPEARWRFSGKAQEAIVRDQRGLVTLGAQLLKPGGVLVYSTCSLEEEENAGVVARVLARRREMRLVRQRRILPAGSEDPARWSDGGYVAILRRS